MKIRAAAFVAVAAMVVFGTAGCEFMTPQQTTVSYQPSDGVNGSAGGVDVRGTMLITTDGTRASLVTTLINTGTSDATVDIQYTAATGLRTRAVSVGAGRTVSVKPRGDVTITFEHVDASAGSLFPVYFQVGGSGAQLQVPVLTNALPGYATLAPSPSPTPTPTPEATATATPSASPTL